MHWFERLLDQWPKDGNELQPPVVVILALWAGFLGALIQIADKRRVLSERLLMALIDVVGAPLWGLLTALACRELGTPLWLMAGAIALIAFVGQSWIRKRARKAVDSFLKRTLGIDPPAETQRGDLEP